jgi:hypothetical protein
MKMPDEKDYAEERQHAIDTHYRRPRDMDYTSPPGHARNVIGVAIGPAMKDGKEETCLCFYVEKKVKEIDEPYRIPSPTIGRLKTDVTEARRFVSFDALGGPGSSIGFDYTAPNVDPVLRGTLGAIFQAGNRWYAVGANHVMAVNGRVPIGKPIMFRPPQKFIVNPNDYIFAVLADYVPLVPEGPDYNGYQPNIVDCAMALVDKPDRVTAQFPRYIVDPMRIIEPHAGMKVGLVDDSNGVSAGEVAQASARVRIDYRFGTFDFEDMVLIRGADGKRFANPGDSGALVLGWDQAQDKATAAPVAMIVGGSQNYTIACKISNVHKKLMEELAKEPPPDHRPENALELFLGTIPDAARKIGSELKEIELWLERKAKSKLQA